MSLASRQDLVHPSPIHIALILRRAPDVPWPVSVIFVMTYLCICLVQTILCLSHGRLRSTRDPRKGSLQQPVSL